MAQDKSGLRLKLVLRDKAALGPGKIALLEAIGETGSIRAAGNRFKMSYRRAWSLVAELNGMFATPLVRAEAGGKGGGGATLTPLGRDVVDALPRHGERAPGRPPQGISTGSRRSSRSRRRIGVAPGLDRSLFLIGNNAS